MDRFPNVAAARQRWAEGCNRFAVDSELRLQKLANQTLLFFVLDASEEFGAQSRDGLSLVERHLVVNLSALKMTGLALCLKDWFDVRLKVRLRRFSGSKTRGGQNGRV